MECFILQFRKKYLYLHPQNANGAIAQLVEQRTENPCVPGSIPGGTTNKNANSLKIRLLAFLFFLARHLYNFFDLKAQE